MRLFNSEQIKQATGDVFGRIYEYFLAKFSVQKAHDNGEFFTPSSLVQTIVNVIEPDHGMVFDPACGSGGMFVQSSHFIEHEGGDTAKKVVFYGQEKNRDTIRIAKMNLAVHGLEGKIAEAITYYQDEHALVGKCDFVMANPPFNVDLVDAERIKSDPRLPFGLPGVNKQKKVSNGNYLWISYFWSYLNEKGRAGFVMSSQASSAGHGEKEVRRKIVETGRRGRDDLHPLQLLLHPHRPLRAVVLRPGQACRAPRQGADARRPQHLPQGHPQDLRFLARSRWEISRPSSGSIGASGTFPGAGQGLPRLASAPRARRFRRNLPPSRRRSPTCAGVSKRLAKAVAKKAEPSKPTKKQALAEAVTELREAAKLYETDRAKLLADLEAFGRDSYAKSLPDKNDASMQPARPSTPSPRRSRASSSKWTCSTSWPPGWPTWERELAADEASLGRL